jgi:hypothetical protein
VTLEDLLTLPGIVAVAGAALALLALLLLVVLAVKLRRVRAAQSAVLGGHERRDLVVHAERLEAGFVDLRAWVEDSLARLEQRSSEQDHRIDGCIAYSALVRYDAYGEMSGQQSSSLALLDHRGSGTVLTSITHRDQARMYIKQIEAGQPELQLSPEEQQAIDAALAPPPTPGAVGVAAEGSAQSG